MSDSSDDDIAPPHYNIFQKARQARRRSPHRSPQKSQLRSPAKTQPVQGGPPLSEPPVFASELREAPPPDNSSLHSTPRSQRRAAPPADQIRSPSRSPLVKLRKLEDRRSLRTEALVLDTTARPGPRNSQHASLNAASEGDAEHISAVNAAIIAVTSATVDVTINENDALGDPRVEAHEESAANADAAADIRRGAGAIVSPTTNALDAAVATNSGSASGAASGAASGTASRASLEFVSIKDVNDSENDEQAYKAGDVTLGLPSSEDVDPQHVEEMLAETRVAAGPTVRLEELIQSLQPNSVLGRSETSAGFFEPVDTGSLDLAEQPPIVNTTGLSRIEQAEAGVLAAALAKLHAKLRQEAGALAALQQAPVAAVAVLRQSVTPLWRASRQHADVSVAKLRCALLRDTRLRLLQLQNDLSHEESEREANERIYDQLSAQIEEATQLVDQWKAAAEESERVAAEIEEREARTRQQLGRLKKVEDDYDAALTEAELAVRRRATAAIPVRATSTTPRITSTGAEVSPALTPSEALARRAETLGARVRLENGVGIISMLFFTARAVLDTGSVEYHFSYPAVAAALGEHYKALILDTRKGAATGDSATAGRTGHEACSLRRAVALWGRCLTILRLLTALFREAPLLSSARSGDTETLPVTTFRLYPRLSVELRGTSVVVRADKPPLQVQCAALEELRRIPGFG